jgi:hypothetical protein
MKARYSPAALILMAQGIDLGDVSAASPRQFHRAHVSRMLSGERRLAPEIIEGIRRVGGQDLARRIVKAVETTRAAP